MNFVSRFGMVVGLGVGFDGDGCVGLMWSRGGRGALGKKIKLSKVLTTGFYLFGFFFYN